MTRSGRPVVGKIRTRVSKCRATGGCQVSHSAGRQIFGPAYRFYWYIEHFLRPRARAPTIPPLSARRADNCECFINNVVAHPGLHPKLAAPRATNPAGKTGLTINSTGIYGNERYCELSKFPDRRGRGRAGMKEP